MTSSFAETMPMIGKLSLSLSLVACLLAARESYQDEVLTESHQSINVSNHQETVKFGNTKTNNYNFHESNYQPTQSTQLVFNVGKWKNKKSRSSRPPTIEEFAIKKQIMAVYQAALDEVGGANSAHLKHLGRILTALNPKYIATRRVMAAAFAEPTDAELEVQAPESELGTPTTNQTSGSQAVECQQQQQKVLELRGDGQASIRDQLEAAQQRVRSLIVWDEAFQRQLFEVSDGELSQDQLALKRLVQCLAHPKMCKHKMVEIVKAPKGDDPLQQFETEPDEAVEQLVAEASELSQIHVVPPEYQPDSTETQQELAGTYSSQPQTQFDDDQGQPRFESQVETGQPQRQAQELAQTSSYYREPEVWSQPPRFAGQEQQFLRVNSGPVQVRNAAPRRVSSPRLASASWPTIDPRSLYEYQPAQKVRRHNGLLSNMLWR